MKRNDIIHTFKAERIVEIGVLRGTFAANLLSTNPKELVLVDPWKVFHGDYNHKTQADWDKMYQQVCRRFSGDKRVKIIRAESIEAAKMFPDYYFDLVYIDADHSYEAVKQDIEAWRHKVMPNGMLGGHDIDTKGVEKAVRERFGNLYYETTEYDENTKGPKFAKSWFINM